MDRFLRVCGIIFLSLVGVAVIAGLIFIPRAWKLNTSAVEFIDRELPRITERWDKEAMLKCASPEFAASMQTDQAPLLWARFRTLGNLKSHEAAVGQVGSQAYANGPTGTFGVYRVRCVFEHGNAEVRITLKRVDADWKIYGFYINSDIFLK